MSPDGGLPAMHVITGLGVGGAESMLTSLLFAQKQMFPQERLRVVSLTSGGANAQRLREAEIEVTELRMRPNRPPGWELLHLAQLIRRETPRVVQSWMYHADITATLALYLSGRRHRTRLIWGLRCSDMDTQHYSARLKLVIRSCALLSKLPDSIVSNSVAGKDVHVKLGYPDNRFSVIPNGIDVDRFRPDLRLRQDARAELGITADEHVVAHVARVDPMKDHACFLRSLTQLQHVKALLIGKGTESLPPHPAALRLGRRDDMPRLLNAADLIVSSSAFGEGFSNAIAEGMASGLPAVTTDTGDARLLVGSTGVVVPPRDPEMLAQGISTLLRGSKEELHQRGAAARQRIMDLFSLNRAVAAFRTLYS